MKQKGTLRASVLLSLLLVSLTPAVKASAAVPALSAAADRAVVEAGGYVTVNITLSNNPPLSTLGMALGYDSGVLKYDSTSWSGSLSPDDMKMASDSGSEVSLSIVCAAAFSSGGTVASVRFQAVADTDSIPVTLSLREIADAQLSAIYDCSVTAAVKTPAKPPQDTEQNNGGSKEPGDASGSRPADKDPEKEPSGSNPDKEQKPSGNGTDNSEKPSGNGTAGSQQPSGGGTVQGGGASAGGTARGGTSGSYTQTEQVTVTPVENQTPGTSSGQVQSVSVSSKADRNYKTGAGIGNDIFLVAACICGIGGLLLLMKKAKGET